MSRILALAAVGGSFLALLGDCTPEPQFVSCENDAMCHEADSRFHFCADSHCVECVTNAECKNGTTCRAGFCKGRDAAWSSRSGST